MYQTFCTKVIHSIILQCTVDCDYKVFSTRNVPFHTSPYIALFFVLLCIKCAKNELSLAFTWIKKNLWAMVDNTILYIPTRAHLFVAAIHLNFL